MIDIHVHGSYGADVMDATDEAYTTMSDFFVTRGVTAFVATALTMPDANFMAILECISNIRRNGNLRGAEVLGVHMEGPFINVEQKGCHPVDLIVEPKPEQYMAYFEYKDVIKQMTLAPELKGAAQLVRDLVQSGILAAAGHTNGIYREMLPAIDAGIKHAVHFFCNMGNFRRDNLKRVAGAMETLLFDDRISTELIADGWHVGDTLMKLTVKVKGIDRVCFVTDAMTAAGMPPGRYFVGNVEAIVEGGIARLPDNTAYASSVTTMDVCVRNGITRMDLPFADSVRMATLTPATIIGIADYKGSLEKGKDADVVIMDGNVDIKKTIAHGNVVYEA
jgi:N-acetylglucosamine-6-phosphate deacetylase